MSLPWLPSLSERLFELVTRVRYAGRRPAELRYRPLNVAGEGQQPRIVRLRADRKLRLVHNQKGARSHHGC